MYDNAPDGDTVAMIHVFGIKYAEEIRISDTNPRQIAESSGIPASYVSEISKGVKLAKYVTLRK